MADVSEQSTVDVGFFALEQQLSGAIECRIAAFASCLEKSMGLVAKFETMLQKKTSDDVLLADRHLYGKAVRHISNQRHEPGKGRQHPFSWTLARLRQNSCG